MPITYAQVQEIIEQMRTDTKRFAEQTALTADNVRSVLTYALCTEAEFQADNTVATEIRGVRLNVFCHNERMLQVRGIVKRLLQQLPEQFHAEKGGGWTFLNMCARADGVQWADAHASMDDLVVLGLAHKLVSFLPTDDRDMWYALLGGVPYIRVEKECWT